MVHSQAKYSTERWMSSSQQISFVSKCKRKRCEIHVLKHILRILSQCNSKFTCAIFSNIVQLCELFKNSNAYLELSLNNKMYITIIKVKISAISNILSKDKYRDPSLDKF